ncbi:MAG: TM2 domain-containing membrane protein YozV [Planctomycetota bacterium]|jgi:TM2 domain-containing membrane protein YozV
MTATLDAPTPKKAQVGRKGEPLIAVLLTWFVPGAGHLYLGHRKLALIAFLVVEGLYCAGLALSEGMFLEYLPAEMRGRFASALTPEVGNLGALLYHVDAYGYGLAFPRTWPTYMDLGTLLTAMSGVFNVMLMSRAHFDARHPVRVPGKPIGPALAAWLSLVIPGLGQFLQGRRARGVLIAAMLTGLFLLGTSLADGTNLDRERHFYYWAGQFMLGAPAWVSEFVHGHVIALEMPLRVDAGIVMGCVAGMLNILVMLDAYGYSEAQHLEVEPPRSAKSTLPTDALARAVASGAPESKSEVQV